MQGLLTFGVELPARLLRATTAATRESAGVSLADPRCWWPRKVSVQRRPAGEPVLPPRTWCSMAGVINLPCRLPPFRAHDCIRWPWVALDQPGPAFAVHAQIQGRHKGMYTKKLASIT